MRSNFGFFLNSISRCASLWLVSLACSEYITVLWASVFGTLFRSFSQKAVFINWSILFWASSQPVGSVERVISYRMIEKVETLDLLKNGIVNFCNLFFREAEGRINVTVFRKQYFYQKFTVAIRQNTELKFQILQVRHIGLFV